MGESKLMNSGNLDPTSFIERMTDAFVALDCNWRYTYVNRKGAELFGRNARDLVGKHIWTEFPEGVGLEFYKAYYKAMAEQVPIQIEQYYPPDDRWFENRIYPSSDGLSIYIQDITERKKLSLFRETQSKVLELIARGRPVSEILNTLILGVEKLTKDMICSIFLLESDGQTLRQVAAPHLPNEFIQAFNGGKIGTSSGSIGTASFRGERVIVADIAADPLWADFREIAHNHNLRACWLEPVCFSSGEVAGSFAMYSPQVKSPGEWELHLIEKAAWLTAIAIERERSEMNLRNAKAFSENMIQMANVIIVELDLKGQVILLNRMGEKVSGYALHELKGKNWFETVVPKDKYPHVWEEFNKLTASGTPKTYEYPILTRSGDERYILWENNEIKRGERSVGTISFGNDITDRKRAERLLTEKEEELRTIIEAEPECIKLVSADGRLLQMNPAGLAMIDADSIDQVRGRSIYPLVEAEYRDSFKSLTEKVFRGERGQIELFIRSLKGRRVRLETQAVPLRNARNEVIALLGLTRDITEHKLSEEALRQSEERLRLALEAAQMGTFDWDIQRNKIIWSRGHEELFGYKPGEFSGTYEAFELRVHPEDLPDINSELANSINKRIPFMREFRVIWPDRSQHWLAGRGEFIFGDSGQPLRMLGVVKEITERKNAEEKLLEKDHLLSESQRIAHIGSWSWDLATRKLFWTEETYRLYGVSPLDFVLDLESFLHLIHPDDRGSMIKWIDDCLAGKNPSELVFHVILRTGEIRTLSGRGDLKRDRENRPFTMVGTVQDITERQRADLELRKAYNEMEEKVVERTKELTETNLKLKEVDRLKSEFLATMSHELRTPLNSIIGFLGITLQEISGTINHEQRKQLSMALGSAKHLLGLINDILDLSRIESGKIEVASDWVDPVEVISEVVKNLGPFSSGKGIRILAETSDKSILIRSDRKKLYQILLNLVNNAIKFTEHGEVKIGCRYDKDLLELTVSDTGIGIKKENMADLFESFRQIERGATRRYHGTGLGLYLCRKLAGLLGGQIRAESEYGKGSCFAVTLPLSH